MAGPDFQVRATAAAALSSSEDAAKVRVAVGNVLGQSGGGVEDSRHVEMTSEGPGSIGLLHDQLRDRHVRAAARKLLLAGREGKRSTLMLNRQAAYGGVLVLCGSPAESPLGPIYLTIESEKLDEVIDWLTAYEAR